MPTEAYALCPLIKGAPHVTEKGYTNLGEPLGFFFWDFFQLISCPVDYPDSCRGGFTNNICQKRTISQTGPGNCIMGERSDMI